LTLITHNWNQLKTFFEAIDYHQLPSSSVGVPQDFLYFIEEETGKTIGFEKSDKISIYLVRRILKRIGLTYEYFVMVYYKDRNKEESS